MKLSDMINIGKDGEELLISAGIKTPEQLIKTGAKDAFVRIRSIDPTQCLSRLNALQGAIMGIRWHYIPDDIKHELKNFYNKL